ncbi:hypothetical protein GWG65_02045 [Bradyrhizobium sp. CSA207]|uniref:hypothetical protein n=1 Tax=Bradyrhizobium sp. CSA207 TaxID=2698826 RepID=UPI0023AFAE37|nr:hypothetical protein [Bradyrhizobium sp. CSA207]MDE5440244.1 hypothetical protein [Bradyrhizobium sp. CSA207]
MYDKTKEEAEKKILQSFVFDGNDLRGVVVEFMPDYQSAPKALRHPLHAQSHRTHSENHP